MSFFTILETLLIGPLKLVFEIIFTVANRVTGHPGLAIIVLSLIMNILVLPLYKRADAMQEENRDIEAKLQRGVSHIKKCFSGDEQMMILQTYYRQNHYKPTDALKGSISLLLEIPFFMAAYQFLSSLDILTGVSFGPIKDLSAPDGLLVIGSVAINLLPIIMTAVNLISSALYLKGYPLKSKIQLYGMALFFLVFLYTSPSCLVFYWTLNNVFSLVKTVFYKLKNPQKVLGIFTPVAGLVILIFGAFIYETDSIYRRSFLILVGLMLQIPILQPLLKGKIAISSEKSSPNRKLFLLGAVFLTVLTGMLIPSTFIAASPQEYVDVSYFHNPVWYIVSALCLAAGAFLIWMNVFYWLANAKGKVFFDKLVWILCGVMLVNYMFFGTDLGIISSNLQYETGMDFSAKEKLINLLILAVIALVMYVCVNRWNRAAATVLLTAIVALGGMSVINVVTIVNSVNAITIEGESGMPSEGDSKTPSFQLSKNGKNVVVLMLDRGMGEYIPYLFNEKPELKEQFDGFTYYSNTISYGLKTNFGSPALLGGYEYTPVELNKRSSESLMSKHNEALKVMPVLFAENGYKVTVCDPVYANYQWIPDLSIFDEYPEIKAYNTKGKFSDSTQKQLAIETNYRNFFCFSIMKSMPIFLQQFIYDGGRYNQTETASDELAYLSQTAESVSKATGVSSAFMESYNVLVNLPYMTRITEEETGTFLYMTNDTTHEPILLQEPDYTPAQIVDNTEYDAANSERFTVDGKTLKVNSPLQMSHYQSNMAALIQLGKWFDYLRENDVYDNTKIIIVSDHGQGLNQLDELVMDINDESKLDASYFFPLLLVKDFDSDGFTVSDEFMTNADVPTLALKDIIEDPKNPFTGKAINSDEKSAHDQYMIVSWDWEVEENNGNAFLPAQWASVKDDIWDKENWTFYTESTVLTEHAFP